MFLKILENFEKKLKILKKIYEKFLKILENFEKFK